MFKNKKKTNGDRRGVATVEFAVLLPIMVLILMGTIECTSMIFLQQSLEIVCYETARSAARPQSVLTDAQTRGAEIVTARSLSGCSVVINPASATSTVSREISTVPRGNAITIRAVAPTTANAFFPVTFFPDTLTAEAVMVKQ